MKVSTFLFHINILAANLATAQNTYSFQRVKRVFECSFLCFEVSRADPMHLSCLSFVPDKVKRLNNV